MCPINHKGPWIQQILSLNGRQYNIINLIICLLFGIFWVLLKDKRCDLIANSIHWIIRRIVNHVFPWNYLTYIIHIVIITFLLPFGKTTQRLLSQSGIPSKIGWFHGIFLNVRNFYTVPLCTVYNVEILENLCHKRPKNCVKFILFD